MMSAMVSLSRKESRRWRLEEERRLRGRRAELQLSYSYSIIQLKNINEAPPLLYRLSVNNKYTIPYSSIINPFRPSKITNILFQETPLLDHFDLPTCYTL